VRPQNHPRRTKAALQRIMLNKCLLDRIPVSILGQAFDRYDLCAVYILNGGIAGKHRLPVDKHRAGAAQPLAATVFEACQCQVCAQYPPQHAFFIDLQVDGFAVELEVNLCRDINPSS